MRDFVNSASRIWLVGRAKLCYNADIIDGETIGRAAEQADWDWI